MRWCVLAILMVPALAFGDAARTRPAKPTCVPFYLEPVASLGLTRDEQKLASAWFVVGFESAPQRCAAPTNLRVGFIMGALNLARDYKSLGAEVEYDRWYFKTGYYGVRVSALTAEDNTFITLGLRLHTTTALSLGVDAVWAQHGPTPSSRTGGDAAVGIQGTVGFRGRLGAVLLGLAVGLGALYVSAGANSS